MENHHQYPKFDCNSCGACCKSSLEAFPESKNLSKVYFYSPDQRVPLLYPWEAQYINGFAPHYGQQIVPAIGWFSHEFKAIFLTHYMFRNMPCPFLSGKNQCLIQNRKPLHCRSHPVLGSGLLSELQLGDCTKKFEPLNPKIIHLPPYPKSLTLHNIYGKSYHVRLLIDLIEFHWEKLVETLHTEGLVKFSPFPLSQRHELDKHQLVDLFCYLHADKEIFQLSPKALVETLPLLKLMEMETETFEVVQAWTIELWIRTRKNKNYSKMEEGEGKSQTKIRFYNY